MGDTEHVKGRVLGFIVVEVGVVVVRVVDKCASVSVLVRGTWCFVDAIADTNGKSVPYVEFVKCNVLEC